MSRVTFLTVVVCGGAVLVWAQGGTNKLAYSIPDLYGASGLTLPNPNHNAHFLNSFQESFSPLNVAVSTQSALLPIASPASGFVYSFDTALGVYNRTSQSLGPILTERAETIGRHKLFVGAAYQYFSFDKLDGVPLDNFPAVFQHAATTSDFGKDYISTSNSIDLKINQFTLFGTFGVTDRFDVSVAVPIVNAHLGVTSAATIQRLAAPNPATPGVDPVTGEAHYFNPADPVDSTQETFGSNRNASGLGDITVRLKWEAFRGESSGFAVLADFRTPSGDAYNFLGSGAMGIRPFVAYSIRIHRVAPHFNLGYQWNGSSVLAGDISRGTKGHLPNALVYAAGLDVGATRRLSFAADLLGTRVFKAERVFRSTYTNANGGAVPTIGLQRSDYNMVNGALGLKVTLYRRLLFTGNAIFALNDAGLRSRVVPLIGLSWSM